ncbi:MAG: hypothetical protein ACRELS_16880 [Candidatus Rokuibacteriota bacterium]
MAAWSVPALAAAVALAARLGWIVLLGDRVGADEAVNGLMAWAIARGEELPLTTWEAQYAGPVVPLLAAGPFALAGPSLLLLRLAALPLALVGAAAVAAAARSLWGAAAGVVAGLAVAVAPPVFALYTTEAIGGYPEVLGFGGLLLWGAVRLASAANPRPQHWIMFGVAGGLATWSMPLLLALFVGGAIALARRRRLSRQTGTFVAAGFLLGIAPYVVHNVLHPGASILRFAGRVLDVSAARWGGGDHAQILAAALARYAAGLADVPRALVAASAGFLDLAPPAAWPVALIVTGAVVWTWARRGADSFGLALAGWTALAGTVLLALGRFDAARHQAVLWLPAALWLGWLATRVPRRARPLGVAALAGFLALNALGTAAHARERLRVAPLVEGLRARGLVAIYTDYFVAYPVIFLSRETILASPAAGPVNVERRPAYSAAVARAPRVAYVFARGSEAGRVFVGAMRKTGRAMGHDAIDGFDVYTPERPVRPSELELLRAF